MKKACTECPRRGQRESHALLGLLSLLPSSLAELPNSCPLPAVWGGADRGSLVSVII